MNEVILEDFIKTLFQDGPGYLTTKKAVNQENTECNNWRTALFLHCSVTAIFP
jgi:hypothetical protein